MEFNNKKIVITGASSGIGLTLLEHLAAVPGAQIIGVARHTDSITALGLANVTALSYDMSKPEAIDSMLTDCMERLGGIDVFFANAGYAYYGKIGPADWAKMEAIYATNTFAPVYTLQKLLELQGSKRLHYVITDSALAKVAIPGFAFYSATKYAIDGFVNAYAFEKPDNVILSTVYPVSTKTNFFKRAANAAPLPFPTQTPEQVAVSVIKGVRKEKRYIYPFASYGFFNWLLNFLPFLKSGYLALEDRKFKKWLKQNP